MARNFASNALTLLIIALVVLGGMAAWGTKQFEAAGPLEQAICLKVRSGANMQSVSSDLAERGAITSAVIFRVSADYAEKSQDLKAGSFLVPATASMAEILDLVTRGGQSSCGTEVNYRIGILSTRMIVRELDPATGRFVEVAAFNPAEDETPSIYNEIRDDSDVRFRVTIAEGTTSWQVVDSLKNFDLLTGEVTSLPEEGSLAPDSYEIRAGADRNNILLRMMEEQTVILGEAWANRADDLPFAHPQEALILASIVEKETGVAAERPMVASVFINRLEQGIRLQTDPAVIYGITNGEGALGRGLRRSELDRETPYNTYKISGLTPTPIANPGRAAIEAVLNPAETSFIFFVADGTGGHAFATTLREHNQNVSNWRAIEAEREAASGD